MFLEHVKKNIEMYKDNVILHSMTATSELQEGFVCACVDLHV